MSIGAEFYDQDVTRRLRDHREGNARVQRAVDRLNEICTDAPESILEVGCGVGYVAGELAVRWPQTTVVGCDLSQRAIELGTTMFGDLPNLTLAAEPLQELEVSHQFDLVLMMDIYEHVPKADRQQFAGSLARLLAPQATVLVTVPTVRHQEWLREHKPQGLQPVDEDVGAREMIDLAGWLDASVILYEEISVWRHRDYTHAILRRGSDAYVDVAPDPLRGRMGRWFGQCPVLDVFARRRAQRRARDLQGRLN